MWVSICAMRPGWLIEFRQRRKKPFGSRSVLTSSLRGPRNEASASPVEAAPAPPAAEADSVSDETEPSSEAFLQRFTEAIDELPLAD